MELMGLYKRVIGLDIHQAQIRPVRRLRNPMAIHASSNGSLVDSSEIVGNWLTGSPR